MPDGSLSARVCGDTGTLVQLLVGNLGQLLGYGKCCVGHLDSLPFNVAWTFFCFIAYLWLMMCVEEIRMVLSVIHVMHHHMVRAEPCTY